MPYILPLVALALALVACTGSSSGAARSVAISSTLTAAPAKYVLAAPSPTPYVLTAEQEAENAARAARVRQIMTAAYTGATEVPQRFYALTGLEVQDDVAAARTSLPDTPFGQTTARELCRDFVAVVDDPAYSDLGLKQVGILSARGTILAIRHNRGDDC